jgi:hypothetical protein
MSGPNNASNRTLAGVAAALGIVLAVAPSVLRAQDTLPKPAVVGAQSTAGNGNSTSPAGTSVKAKSSRGGGGGDEIPVESLVPVQKQAPIVNTLATPTGQPAKAPVPVVKPKPAVKGQS